MPSRLKEILRNRKALSPIVATIILIAITIVGGLLAYNVFMSVSGTAAAKGQISVEYVDLVKQTDGSAVFTITAKNSGGKPAIQLAVTFLGNDYNLRVGGQNVSNNNPLQPGQSATLTITFPAAQAGALVVGNTYTYVVQATFSDNSMFTITGSVMCRM